MRDNKTASVALSLVACALLVLIVREHLIGIGNQSRHQMATVTAEGDKSDDQNEQVRDKWLMFGVTSQKDEDDDDDVQPAPPSHEDLVEFVHHSSSFEFGDTPTRHMNNKHHRPENFATSFKLSNGNNISSTMNETTRQVQASKRSSSAGNALLVRQKRRANLSPPPPPHNNERGRPILNEFSFPANLVQGMRFVLMCQVLDGEPPIQIKWFKDNLDLSASLAAFGGSSQQVAGGGGLASQAALASSSSSSSSSLPTNDDDGDNDSSLAAGQQNIELISSDELVGSSLLFRKVRPQHSGNYTCLASNHLGESSYSSLMTVKVPPTWRVEPRDRVESITGEQIAIDCQAIGNPNPFIRWKFASAFRAQQQQLPVLADNAQLEPQLGHHQSFKLINSNHHMQTLENGTLIIRHASREQHEGAYLCEADNGIAQALTKQVQLIVHKQAHFVDDIQVQWAAPQQQQQQQLISSQKLLAPIQATTSQQPLKTIRLAQNSSLVRLVCQPYGELPLQFEWRKDGRTLHTHVEPPLQGEQSLTKQLAAAADNDDQSLENQRQLAGRYHFNTRSLPASSSVSQIVRTVQRNSETSGLESELLIASLTRADAGTFECRARNAFGQSERKLHLVVLELPDAPQLLEVAHISSRSIGLRWLAPFDGNSPIVKYVLEYKRARADSVESPFELTSGDIDNAAPIQRSEKLMPLNSGLAPQQQLQAQQQQQQLLASSGQQQHLVIGQQHHQVQHTVHELEPLTRYSMRVLAVNALGQSKPSVALSLKTEEEVPSTVPNLVEAKVLSSRSIKLHWTISYAHEHELIDGFFIGYRSFDPTIALTATPPNSANGSGKEAQQTFTYKTIRLINAGHSASTANNAVTTSEQHATLSPISSITKTVPQQHHQQQQQTIAGNNIKSGGGEIAIVISSFEYVIGNLERDSEYTILIQCFNKKGAGPASDALVTRTFVNDPPEKLTLLADEPTESSLRLAWRFQNEMPPVERHHSNEPVDGFVLTYAKVTPQMRTSSARNVTANFYNNHRQQQQPNSAARIQQQQMQTTGVHQFSPPVQVQQLHEQLWQAIQLAPQQRQHQLKGLECGTWYAMKIWAFNKWGKGEPSDLVSVSTRGKAPIAPNRKSFLSINSTQVRLHLMAWHDGGCEIEKFIVQYRARGQAEWILVSNNILREQNSVLIRELSPATTYELLVGVQNHVGQTDAKYRFSTLDADGKQVAVSGVLASWPLKKENNNGDAGDDDDDDDDANLVVDYTDDTRREMYSSDANYLALANASNKWLVLVRMVLSSPLTLLLALCLFLVLLVMLLFHRFNSTIELSNSSNDSTSRSGTDSGGNGNCGSSSSSANTINSNKLLQAPVCLLNANLARPCSFDGHGASMDHMNHEQPPLSLSTPATNGSPLTESPAAPSQAHATSNYAPLPVVNARPMHDIYYGTSNSLASNYCATRQHNECSPMAAYGYAGASQYNPQRTTTAHTGDASNQQQYLMQMLMMSPHATPEADAATCATLAHQSASLQNAKPNNNGTRALHCYNSATMQCRANNSSNGPLNHFTLGRQQQQQNEYLLWNNNNNNTLQMSTFKNANLENGGGGGGCGESSLSSGHGTLMSVLDSDETSDITTNGRLDNCDTENKVSTTTTISPYEVPCKLYNKQPVLLLESSID